MIYHHGPPLTVFSERAIANWESGDGPDEPGPRRIREAERFLPRLAEVVQAETIAEWLDSPNDAFGGLKPLEVIERGGRSTDLSAIAALREIRDEYVNTEQPSTSTLVQVAPLFLPDVMFEAHAVAIA